MPDTITEALDRRRYLIPRRGEYISVPYSVAAGQVQQIVPFDADRCALILFDANGFSRFIVQSADNPPQTAQPNLDVIGFTPNVPTALVSVLVFIRAPLDAVSVVAVGGAAQGVILFARYPT